MFVIVCVALLHPWLSTTLGGGDEGRGGAADRHLQHPSRGPAEATGAGTAGQGDVDGVPDDLVCSLSLSYDLCADVFFLSFVVFQVLSSSISLSFL